MNKKISSNPFIIGLPDNLPEDTILLDTENFFKTSGEKVKMKLKDTNWTAVHFDDRALLPSDKSLYGKSEWDNILNLEVEPMEAEGHFRVICTAES